MVEASRATGSLGTVLVDDAGEASGYSVEGLVLKIMANHFGGARPVDVGGNSPQQAVPGTPWVDTPELGVRTGPGARALEGAADGAQQDAEHGAGKVWVAG